MSAERLLRKARSHERRGEKKLAAEVYREVLERYPENQRAIKALDSLEAAEKPARKGDSGILREFWELYQQQQNEKALILGMKLSAMNPDSAELANMLGILYSRLAQPENAATWFKKATDIKPDNVDALSNLGASLNNINRSDLAIPVLENAIRLEPRLAQARNNLGVAYEKQHEIVRARHHYQKALEIEPDYVSALRHLAVLSEQDQASKLIETMLELLQKDDLQMEDKVQLHFGLGELFERLGEHARSDIHYNKGNRLKRSTFEYSTIGWRENVEKITALYPLETIKLYSTMGLSSVKPVFIVGMPRSGKSTLESVLAGYAHIKAGGEFGDFERILLKEFSSLEQDQILSNLDEDSILRVGEQYLKALEDRSNGQSYVCNTMPHNFKYLGLIKIIFPHSLIFHCRRDPSENQKAIYKKYFAAAGHFYAYSMDDLAGYFAGYQRLMDFWDSRILLIHFDLGGAERRSLEATAHRLVSEYMPQ
jgi:tetratricopeptide (TPR) repeat protein